MFLLLTANKVLCKEDDSNCLVINARLLFELFQMLLPSSPRITESCNLKLVGSSFHTNLQMKENVSFRSASHYLPLFTVVFAWRYLKEVSIEYVLCVPI